MNRPESRRDALRDSHGDLTHFLAGMPDHDHVVGADNMVSTDTRASS